MKNVGYKYWRLLWRFDVTFDFRFPSSNIDIPRFYFRIHSFCMYNVERGLFLGGRVRLLRSLVRLSITTTFNQNMSLKELAK